MKIQLYLRNRLSLFTP